MTKEEYESLQDAVIKDWRELMDREAIYSLTFSSIKRKVAERLIAEKGGFTPSELWEEINKEFEKE